MSTELATIQPEYVDIWDEPETNDSLATDIENLLDSIGGHEFKLATSYVQLGVMLLRAQKEKFWGGYSSYARYLGYISTRIKRARSQIYAYVGVADRLLPFVSEVDLEQMGISRAQELSRFVKQSGRKVPEGLLLLALDDQKTIEELHTEVLKSLNEKGEVKGKWWSPLEGGYFTDEEKKEVQQALDSARNLLELGSDSPEHLIRKEIIMSLVREFVSSNPMEG